MTKLNKALLTAALLTALSGQAIADGHGTEAHDAGMDKAECSNPVTAPIIPDGNVASLDELIAAQGSVKAFQANLIEYRECLTAHLIKEPADETGAQKNAALNAAYDSSVDAETKIVEEFSVARVAFQSRQPKKK